MRTKSTHLSGKRLFISLARCMGLYSAPAILSPPPFPSLLSSHSLFSAIHHPLTSSLFLSPQLISLIPSQIPLPPSSVSLFPIICSFHHFFHELAPSSCATPLISFSSLHSIIPFLIKNPTRVTDNTSSILDVLITNKPDTTLHTDAFPYDTADHELLT